MFEKVNHFKIYAYKNYWGSLRGPKKMKKLSNGQKRVFLNKMGVNQGIGLSRSNNFFTSFITHQNSLTKKVVVKSKNVRAK